MSIISMARICAVVGLSAVTFVSSLLRTKNENGLINRPSFSNGNPYNCNAGDDNMYNNAYGSQSRRFFGGFGGFAPQPQMAFNGYQNTMMCQPQMMRPLSFGPSQLPQPSPQLQSLLQQYGYQTPGCNNVPYQPMGYVAPMGMNYQQPASYCSFNNNMNYNPYQQPMSPSRRNMTGFNQYQSPTTNLGSNYGPQSYFTQAPNPTTGIYREPRMVDPAVQALYGNYTPRDYGYAWSGNNTNYVNYNTPQMNNNPWSQPAPQVQQTNIPSPSQPMMNLGMYNSIIGSAARYKYWCPSSSYGTGVTYYGYDENCPSYPPPPVPPQRPMMNVMPTFNQAPPQPQFQRPQFVPQFNPQQFQRPNNFDFQAMMQQKIAQQQMARQQRMAQMNNFQRPMPSFNNMQQPVQPQPQPQPQPQMNQMNQFGEYDNNWFTIDELNTLNSNPQPQPAEQQAPMQSNETIPPMDSNMDTQVSMDAILRMNQPQPNQNIPEEEIDPTKIIMTFGPQEEPQAPMNQPPVAEAHPAPLMF